MTPSPNGSTTASAQASSSGLIAALMGERMSERTKRLMSIYALATVAWQAIDKLRKKLSAHAVFTVAVPGNDPIFADVHAWLLLQIPPSAQRALLAKTTMTRTTAEAVPVDTSAGARRESGRLVTSYDSDREQQVAIEGHKVIVAVSTDTGSMMLSERHSYEDYYRSRQKIQFTTTTVAGRDAVLRFLREVTARRAAADRPPSFRMANRWGGWETRDDLPTRTLDTVVLAAGQRDDLVADVAEFLANETAYSDLGVPWHRGYLLHGPPGTGKTSIARALASHFGLDVYYLPLAAIAEDGTLLQLVASVTARSMLLLEDIDVAVDAALDRDTTAATAAISMSGLLNALDGMMTPHGLITVMTTNRAEVLDAAIIRSGRIDKKVEIGNLTTEQLTRLIRQFVDVDVTIPVEGPVTPAEVVGAIIEHLHDPDACITAIRRLCTPPDR